MLWKCRESINLRLILFSSLMAFSNHKMKRRKKLLTNPFCKAHFCDAILFMHLLFKKCCCRRKQNQFFFKLKKKIEQNKKWKRYGWQSLIQKKKRKECPRGEIYHFLAWKTQRDKNRDILEGNSNAYFTTLSKCNSKTFFDFSFFIFVMLRF